jgi:hypothetical protein
MIVAAALRIGQVNSAMQSALNPHLKSEMWGTRFLANRKRREHYASRRFSFLRMNLLEGIRSACGELEGIRVKSWRRVADVVVDDAGIKGQSLVHREGNNAGEIG